MSFLLEATPPPDLLDRMVTVLIILFILCVITEKITQLVRHYPQRMMLLLAPMWLLVFVNLSSDITLQIILLSILSIAALAAYYFRKNPLVAQVLDFFTLPNISTEKRDNPNAAKEVFLLSFLIGVGIAAFFKVDLFRILSTGEVNLSNNLSWWTDLVEVQGSFPFVVLSDGRSFKSEHIFKLISIVITGFFLSFGSKFFHDLLDTLLQVKNLKRKINEKETYEVETIKEFDEYLKTSKAVFAHDLVKQQGSQLKRLHPNIRSIYSGTIPVNGERQAAVIIQLSDGKQKGLPKELVHEMKTGKRVTIPVKVIPNVAVPQAHNGPGAVIYNNDGDIIPGALGCVVEDDSGDKYFLTCSHVALKGNSTNLGGEVSNPNDYYFAVEEFGPPSFIDGLHYALLDSTNDAALIGPVMNPGFNEIDGTAFGLPRQINVTQDLNQPVKFKSPVAGAIKMGIIHQPVSPESVPFQYDDHAVHSFSNMILLTAERGTWYESISEKGDSGSVVLDQFDQPIGMVIGGNEQFTYALPLLPILNHANVHTV